METLAETGLEASIADRLEAGEIVRFPGCPFPLPGEADLDFLRHETPGLLSRKNISYHPETGRVHGLGGTAAQRGRARAILQEHQARVEGFLAEAAPSLALGARAATCSFRPVEERGRALSNHASNELLHVDASAYGATHGDRIFRFFVNIHPRQNRVWRTKGTLPVILASIGRRAGLIRERYPRGLRESAVRRLFSGALGRLSRAGLPLDRLLDGSPYDRAMRRLHNYMKESAEFQNEPAGLVQVEFAPYTAWAAFTDMVSHACVSGRFALVSTFIVPAQNCRRTSLVPYHLLDSFLQN